MSPALEEEFRGTERFAVQRRLGAGAFGVVYQVFDRERGADVALKTLREANVEALFCLKREFRALADIAHRNLVTLHELLADGERWFFTMELVEGVNFLQFVRGELGSVPALPDDPTSPAVDPISSQSSEVTSRHPGRPERIRGALRQAVAGIQALHHAGQLHRDIKPSNVLVTREGRLVLLDFGLVTDLVARGSKPSASIVGTPAYMSPEQGAALPVSEASDWYSLGVMLFEAITGRWPFVGSFVEMMWEKRNSDPPLPRDVSPNVPEDLNDLCRDLLRRDPQTRPTGEQILSRLGGVQAATWDPETSTASPRRAPAFVGRESHLTALRSAFEATREGGTIVVRLHGASGAGKTALARHFLAGLREDGAVVLSGRCYEREAVPYKALDSLVDALSQFLKRLPPAQATEILPRDVLALAKLFPVLRRVESIAGARRRVLEIPDSQELRRRAFAALRELLTRLAEQREIVLFIDDLQWGDVDSAALLSDLLRPPRPPPLLLIACYRTEETESSPFLRSFFSPETGPATVETRELPVGELGSADMRDLAVALLRDSPASQGRAEAIARESRGNPFFLSELVRFAQAGLEPSERESEESLGGTPVGGTTTLEKVISTRVALLPLRARRLLEIVAVAGGPIQSFIAREAAGLTDEEHLIDLLRARHLIRTRVNEGRDEIEAYHDRIRETVAGRIQAGNLKSHHRRLALALEASGQADPEALALHFQEAGDPERAAEYAAAAAGRASEALAFYRAARLYRLALELTPLRAPGRRELSIKLGDALSNAGRSAEAAETYVSAIDGAPAANALDLRRRAAEQFLIGGHLEEGLSALRIVLAQVGMHMPTTSRGALLSFLLHRVLVRLRGRRFRRRDPTQVSAERLTRIDVCWSAAKGLILAEPLRGQDFLARQLLLALDAGEPFRVARALAMEAANSATSGSRTRRRTQKLLIEATALAESVGDPYAVGFTMSVAGLVAFLEGDWRTARELTERAGLFLRERCRGVSWELDNAHYYSLLVLFYLGDLRLLHDALPGCLKEAEDRGDLFAAVNIRTRISYLVRLANDEPAEARRELKEAIGIWSGSAFRLQHWYELYGRVECSLYGGDAESAWEELEAAWPALKSSLLLRVQSVRIHSLFLRGRAAIAVGVARQPGFRRELLRRAARDAGRIARERTSWGDALARLLGAGIVSADGDTNGAAALLESVEQEFRAADMGLHATVARRSRGRLIAGKPGLDLVEDSDAWMSAQNIKRPARFAAFLAPGTWT